MEHNIERNNASVDYVNTHNSRNRSTGITFEKNGMPDDVSGAVNNNRRPPRSTRTKSANSGRPDDVYDTINNEVSNNSNNQYHNIKN